MSNTSSELYPAMKQRFCFLPDQQQSPKSNQEIGSRAANPKQAIHTMTREPVPKRALPQRKKLSEKFAKQRLIKLFCNPRSAEDCLALISIETKYGIPVEFVLTALAIASQMEQPDRNQFAQDIIKCCYKGRDLYPATAVFWQKVLSRVIKRSADIEGFRSAAEKVQYGLTNSLSANFFAIQEKIPEDFQVLQQICALYADFNTMRHVTHRESLVDGLFTQTNAIVGCLVHEDDKMLDTLKYLFISNIGFSQ